VAVGTPTERIGKLEQTAAVLVERADNLGREVERVEANSLEATKLLQDLDKRLALAVRDAERLEKKLDELLSRRWELWKFVLAAFLGSVLTVGASFVSRSLDRLIGVGSSQVVPTGPTPNRKG
jgi:hypothetical protein